MNKSVGFSQGLAQIPLMIVLLLLAIAVPVTTKLVKDNQDNRNMAAGNKTYSSMKDCRKDKGQKFCDDYFKNKTGSGSGTGSGAGGTSGMNDATCKAAHGNDSSCYASGSSCICGKAGSPSIFPYDNNVESNNGATPTKTFGPVLPTGTNTANCTTGIDGSNGKHGESRCGLAISPNTLFTCKGGDGASAWSHKDCGPHTMCRNDVHGKGNGDCVPDAYPTDDGSPLHKGCNVSISGWSGHFLEGRCGGLDGNVLSVCANDKWTDTTCNPGFMCRNDVGGLGHAGCVKSTFQAVTPKPTAVGSNGKLSVSETVCSCNSGKWAGSECGSDIGKSCANTPTEAWHPGICFCVGNVLVGICPGGAVRSCITSAGVTATPIPTIYNGGNNPVPTKQSNGGNNGGNNNNNGGNTGGSCKPQCPSSKDVTILNSCVDTTDPDGDTKKCVAGAVRYERCGGAGVATSCWLCPLTGGAWVKQTDLSKCPVPTGVACNLSCVQGKVCSVVSGVPSCVAKIVGANVSPVTVTTSVGSTFTVAVLLNSNGPDSEKLTKTNLVLNYNNTNLTYIGHTLLAGYKVTNTPIEATKGRLMFNITSAATKAAFPLNIIKVTFRSIHDGSAVIALGSASNVFINAETAPILITGGLRNSTVTIGSTIGGDGSILNYKVSFGGVNPNSAQCVVSWPLQFIVMGGGVTKSYTGVIPENKAVVGNKLVFSGSLALTGFTKNSGIAVFIKGIKHIQVKYCKNNQSEACTQAGGQITLTGNTFSPLYDFSNYPLIPGDVTGSSTGGQDGWVNGVDFSYVKAKALLHETVSKGSYLNGDLDGNCQVNSNDVNLLKISLQDKQGQLY